MVLVVCARRLYLLHQLVTINKLGRQKLQRDRSVFGRSIDGNIACSEETPSTSISFRDNVKITDSETSKALFISMILKFTFNAKLNVSLKLNRIVFFCVLLEHKFNFIIPTARLKRNWHYNVETFAIIRSLQNIGHHFRCFHYDTLETLYNS